MMDTTGKTRATSSARHEDEMFFVKDTTLQVVLSREALEPREKNHVCGSVKCARLCVWVEYGVHSPRRLQKESPLPVCEKP